MQAIIQETGVTEPSEIRSPQNLPDVHSIPAHVFLNHFFAVHYHIRQFSDAFNLTTLSRFLNFSASPSVTDIEQIKRQLLNGWSTEYALRTTAELGNQNESYLRHALHWTFPQAYYSIFAVTQAFLTAMGVSSQNVDRMRREIGRLVVKGYYPQPIAFYAAGHHGEVKLHRLPLSHYAPSLQLVSKEWEAQAQIGQFLRTTRKRYADIVRQRVQSNPDTALRSQRTGKIIQRFTEAHWQQLTWRVGYTTFFDLLCRLRISDSHREIDRFVDADIDFTLFHHSLLEIVNYVNFVHESYIAKALTVDRYQQLISELPPHLREGFVRDRWQNQVAPLLSTQSSDKEPITLGIPA